MKNKKYKITVIMVDGSFRESFHSIDFLGKQTLAEKDYELIWVEYYDRVKPELQDKISRYSNFRVLTLNKQGQYHSSYCFNAGIMASRGELIVIPDADVVVEENFLDQVSKEHEINHRLVMYIYRYNEFEKDHLSEVSLEHLRGVCMLTNTFNYGGCLTVRKKWLLAINGYEQHPVFATGFHANGMDVYTRLKNLGLHIMWHPKLKLYHPWHPSTLAKSSAYDLQNIIINYRTKKLMTNSFQGIDSSLNYKFPEELSKQIENKIKPQVRLTSNSQKTTHKLLPKNIAMLSWIANKFKFKVTKK